MDSNRSIFVSLVDSSRRDARSLVVVGLAAEGPPL
jgi:hypothetical protein